MQGFHNVQPKEKAQTASIQSVRQLSHVLENAVSAFKLLDQKLSEP